MLYSVLQLHL